MDSVMRMTRACFDITVAVSRATFQPRRTCSGGSRNHAAGPLPRDLGVVGDGVRSAPPALTQLVLLVHVLQAREQLGG